ncbi:bifunctional DNA-binding transcriptional regulator/O6-methylguanine-DNA methyltransferase Ada [Acidisarcina polymorpha]|nr:bifunctional DNA-binding transcriptional regulator/O6-methylguanine-DNA methyltransferase Ada [Acidisarcina polymorpha]
MNESKCWQSVIDKDQTKDGKFFYGVMTTKVFCRPGCPSRAPLRKNVRFYETAERAQADGLRPCMRCKPLEVNRLTDQDRFSEIRRYIQRNLDSRELLKLEMLSRNFGLSPFHFQRTFKSVVGLTPKQYIQELRMQTFKEELRDGASISGAVYGAGFGSSSRVYERLDTQLGMTPKEYRSGGDGVAISFATFGTPLGLMMLGATDRGLCFLEFGTSAADLSESLRQEYPRATIKAMLKPYSTQFIAWVEALSGYLEGEKAIGAMPIALHGTAFQVKVWRYLQTIPSGSVQSYSEVAEAIGKPKAARAVASACAANRIALVVPCHRVIRGDGSLGGYRWGLERKRALLDAERQALATAH